MTDENKTQTEPTEDQKALVNGLIRFTVCNSVAELALTEGVKHLRAIQPFLPDSMKEKAFEDAEKMIETVNDALAVSGIFEGP